MTPQEYSERMGAPMTEEEAREHLGNCLLFSREDRNIFLGWGVLSLMLEEQRENNNRFGIYYYVICSYQLGVIAGKRAERKRRQKGRYNDSKK